MHTKDVGTTVVTTMNRTELRDTMLLTGELERFTKTPNWERAFELYKTETGDYEVSLGCGNCYAKVKKWLTK